jgi:Protein of unknown function (DUF1064)
MQLFSIIYNFLDKSMKRNKFNAVKTTIDNITFHSKKESVRYGQLKLYEKGGLITDLRLQVSYELIPKLVINGKTERAIKYIADFVYFDTVHKVEVVDDCKGYRTDIYKIKYRLMKMIHGIDIKES